MSVRIRRGFRRSLITSLILAASASLAFAAEVHGRVTDALGATIVGEQLALI
jgi:hypothetical protein